MAQLIDLSHPIEHGQSVCPGDPVFESHRHATIRSDKYRLTRLALGSHHGTHVDAPSHIYANGQPVDRVDLGQCYGPAVLVDLAPHAALSDGTPISLDMLRTHAAAFRAGARVIYRTGWDRWFGQNRFFHNYPSLTPDAARWIASRNLRLLGMDTPGPSSDWLPIHRILLDTSPPVVILESLANLSRLPRRFTLCAFPLRLQGIDGSPVRAVAIAC